MTKKNENKVNWNFDAKTEFSRGFDAGNYAATYESEDFSAVFPSRSACPNRRFAFEYRNGFTLGFFSSYELHEISNPKHRERVEALRANHLDDCLADEEAAVWRTHDI